MVDLDGTVLGDPKKEQGIAELAESGGNQDFRNRLGEILSEAGLFAYPLLMTCLCPPAGLELLYELIAYGPRKLIKEMKYEESQRLTPLQCTG